VGFDVFVWLGGGLWVWGRRMLFRSGSGAGVGVEEGRGWFGCGGGTCSFGLSSVRGGMERYSDELERRALSWRGDFEVDCVGGRGRCGESRCREGRCMVGLRWKRERSRGQC